MITPQTVTRSIVIPIAGPAGEDTWETLRPALREAWGEATNAANWILTECYARDIRREPALVKMPRWDRPYLYPDIRARYPALASQTVASLERETARIYAAARYEVLWTGARSLPTIRYPVPLPIPSQMWRLEPVDQGWGISLRLAGHRVLLRFRGGPHFARHREVVKQVADGDLKAGAAYLYQRTSHVGDHRTGVTRQSRLMVRLCVDLPVRTPCGLAGTLAVTTGPEALLTARTEAGTEWVEHMDHLRRGLLAAARRQQVLADDLKAERRRPRRQTQGIVQRMGEIARRREALITSGIHETAAHLAGYAARQRVASVAYEDRDRSWCPAFPWARLKARIVDVCAERGLTVTASSEVAIPASEPLADGQPPAGA